MERWGPRLGRAFIRAIDRVLIWRYAIFAFSDDPACVLRLSPAKARRAMTLHDGTRVLPGDSLLEIHLWNERLPLMPSLGATSAWGIRFTHNIRKSLYLLSEFLDRTPRFDSVHVLHAEMGFLQEDQLPQMRQFADLLGMDFKSDPAPGWKFWRYEFWANLYSWWLMWAFNPASLRGKHLTRMARGELWLARATLDEKYGVDRH